MSTTTKQATQGLFELAKASPFNVAPERAEELVVRIFGAEKWTFRRSETEANFYALPSERVIYVSYAGLASVWCLARVAVQIFDIASRKQRSHQRNDGQTLDIGDELARFNASAYIKYVEKLLVTDAPWPEGLDLPDIDAEPGTPNGLATNGCLGALGWMVLHEIAHVYHGDSPLVPPSISIQQEHRADAFATRWILDRAGKGLLREFRVIVISIALAWLLLGARVRLQGSTHPAAIHRFRETAERFQVGARSVALESAGYFLKAVFDPDSTPPSNQTPREMFNWIGDRLGVLLAPRR